WGKNGEGDDLAGIDPDPPAAFVAAQMADPLAAPHAALGGATIRVLYDLERYSAEGGPAAFHTLTRETHKSDLPPGGQSRLQHRRVYRDGQGRAVQTKALAPSDPSSPSVARWVASGSVVYNNKGKKVRQFEPFFTTGPGFGLATHGVSAVALFDPLGRN